MTKYAEVKAQELAVQLTLARFAEAFGFWIWASFLIEFVFCNYVRKHIAFNFK